MFITFGLSTLRTLRHCSFTQFDRVGRGAFRLLHDVYKTIFFLILFKPGRTFTNYPKAFIKKHASQGFKEGF